MNKMAIIAGIIVVLAAGGVVALTLSRPDGTEEISVLKDRIEQLETRVKSQEKQISNLELELDTRDLPVIDIDLATRLAALEARAVERDGRVAADSTAGTSGGDDVMMRLRDVEYSVAESERDMSYTIEEQVEEAVDQKIARIEERKKQKQNKKPSMQVFSEVLELSDTQRTVVEGEIWVGQNEIRTILETRTEDGSDLVDGLVEALAYGEAKRPEAPWVFMTWLGRVIGEKIPGSDETYGGRIESAKNDVRTALRRELTAEQYAEFESWRMDPTEVQDITDSPWADLEERIAKRAAELSE